MKHKPPRYAHALPAVKPAAVPVLWGYGIGAALIGMGLLVLAVALGSALRSATRGVHKLTVPGSQRLALSEGFHVGVFRPLKPGTPPPVDLSVEITEEGGGRLPVAPIPEQLRPADDKEGVPLFQVQVPFKESYTVRTLLPAETAAEVYLIHQSVAQNRADLLVGGILFVVLGGFGTYLLILTHRRRSK